MAVETGIWIRPLRKRGGRCAVALDAVQVVRYLDLPDAAGAKGGRFASILTSRPAWSGARRHQLVPAGEVLNFSRLAVPGSPADNTTLAQASGATLSA